MLPLKDFATPIYQNNLITGIQMLAFEVTQTYIYRCNCIDDCVNFCTEPIEPQHT